MTFDSKDEEYISWWLQELKEANIIDFYIRGDSYSLNESLINCYTETKQLKTKTSTIQKTQVLIPLKVYTPDFEIIWNNQSNLLSKFTTRLHTHGKYNNILYDSVRGKDNKLYYSSIIEVKPIYDRHNMTRLFKTNQAIMWSRHNIYVNLLDYQTLFEKTFTPTKYLLTEKTLKEKKIKWNVKSLEEFINNK